MSDVFGRQPVTLVEIDQDSCSLIYGTSPCTAELGVTGAKKCFNTIKTCQDRANYDKTTLTLRFCKPAANIPASWQAIPSVASVSTSPTKLNIGGISDSSGPLGTRATITIKLTDHPYSDAKTDKYISDRNYDPEQRGTFWTKFLARSPFYQNRPLRVREGYIDQDPGDMVTRHYIIDGIDGPDSSGAVTIRGIDILRLVDDRRTKAPRLTPGELLAGIDDSVTSLSVVNAAPDDYDEAGTIRIDDEVMTYAAREVVEQTGGDAWNFTTTDESWTGANATVSSVDGALQVLATASDPRILSPGSLTINGSVARIVRARVMRLNGSDWQGALFYVTSGHGISGSFFKSIPDTTILNKWVTLEWNMADLTAGGDDWITSTITQLRFDFGVGAVGDFLVDWVLVGGLEQTDFTGITRGTDNTDPADHDIESGVQLCYRVTNEAAYTVALNLIQDFAGQVYDVVDVTEWNNEGAFWLPQFLVSALITEPTGINTLISELCQQAQFYIWWDEREQKVKLRANRPPTETPTLINEHKNIIAGSQQIKVAPDERVSQVWVYYQLRSPVSDLNKEISYNRVRIRRDAEAESAEEFGDVKIRRIFSRWIKSDAVALNLATRILNKYRDNPRYLTVSLDAKDRHIWTADIVDVESRLITDDTGAIGARRFEVISAEEVKPGEIVKYVLQSADVLTGRFGFWTAHDAPDYDTATEEQKLTLAFWANDSGLMPDGEAGYEWQ
jgi:hypothetical protein